MLNFDLINCTLTKIIRQNHVYFNIFDKKSFLTKNSKTYFHKTVQIFKNQNENIHLQRIFDDQNYFIKFEKSGKNLNHENKTTGLFNNAFLKSPNGFLSYLDVSLNDSKKLVSSMLEDKSFKGDTVFIRKLDQLSDNLCRIIDLAEFIRVVHDNVEWVDSAQKVYEVMYEYMNELNTNTDLYMRLKKVLADQNVCKILSDEELNVGKYLKRDFEKSGIHMSLNFKTKFISLNQEISLLGSQFVKCDNKLESSICKISKEDFNTIEHEDIKNKILHFNSSISSEKKRDLSSYLVPLNGSVSFKILRNCSFENLRRKIWMAMNSYDSKQLTLLNAILLKRAELAELLNYKSYSHYVLEDKMIKNPENLNLFLLEFKNYLIKNGLIEEVKKLYNLKTNSSENNINDFNFDFLISQFKPWDRDYLSHKLSNLIFNKNDFKNIEISHYFSLGTVFSGLSTLFKKIFNVKLIPVVTSEGETWKSFQVRKILVSDISSNSKLGYLYLDFFSQNVLPSHFTIVCLRKLNLDLKSEDVNYLREVVPLDETEKNQLPLVSIVCNFFNKKKGDNNESTVFLSLDQIDTLFHEMGHAIHSMIAKTDLHNLSGTRCCSDFVELPSNLMECFSNDSRVLHEISSHYLTKEKLSFDVIDYHKKKISFLNQCEQYFQLKMSILDQELHGEKIIKLLNKNNLKIFNSTRIYHEMESEMKFFSDQYSNSHVSFLHLFSYGSLYYSYIFGRFYANKIWNKIFKKDPWSSKSGQKYINTILKWGGNRDPWVSLADVLDDEELLKNNFSEKNKKFNLQ